MQYANEDRRDQFGPQMILQAAFLCRPEILQEIEKRRERLERLAPEANRPESQRVIPAWAS